MPGKSLQDQLRELGLGKKPGSTAGSKRRKASRAKPAREEVSLDQAYRLRERDEKRTAQEKKEQKRLVDLQRRRINKEVQALVDAHGLNDEQAEIKRNFLYKGRIRSVLCTPGQLQKLNAGELGVVFLRGNYILMLPEHVERVRAISADHVPDLGTGDESGQDTDEDDRYRIPDDLIW